MFRKWLKFHEMGYYTVHAGKVDFGGTAVNVVGLDFRYECYPAGHPVKQARLTQGSPVIAKLPGSRSYVVCTGHQTQFVQIPQGDMEVVKEEPLPMVRIKGIEGLFTVMPDDWWKVAIVIGTDGDHVPDCPAMQEN